MSTQTINNLIAEWVEPNAAVLDLGCGSGSLLQLLQANKQVAGVGVEIDEELIASCITSGLQVIQTDIEQGLGIFEDASYDCVILAQTLQELQDPTYVLQEMLRVGKQALVVITNAGHWEARLSFLSGKTPAAEGVAKRGITRLVTIADFQQLCQDNSLTILKSCYLSDGGETKFAPLAKSAVYLIGRTGA